MQFFKMLSLAGAAMLAVGSMSVNATPVSCSWVTTSGGGSGGYGQFNQSCKDASNSTIASRQINSTPTGSTCTMTFVAAGYDYSGSACSPSFFTVGSSSVSSVSTSSAPATKVVNGVTVPFTATVWTQGTCYSYGCSTPSQTCYNTYRGTFAMAPYPSQNYVCYTN
ncbi:hypothetical protein [Cellvibrio sp. pealriver]|uniref:hypothetical protein n=1 Tax=Cellvibrio sp. pealriver TaxID=1622269 RepID=UPI000A70CB7D|nr:hypothetical protein [Cellvibrio sp. pealriver]